MKMMRVHVTLWFVLLIGGFLLGFVPEYLKNRNLQAELQNPQKMIDGLKQQLQMSDLRDAASPEEVRGQLAAFPFLKHLGIYGYRRELLLRLVRWPVSALEAAERLDVGEVRRARADLAEVLERELDAGLVREALAGFDERGRHFGGIPSGQ